jgi:hypothetical protein
VSGVEWSEDRRKQRDKQYRVTDRQTTFGDSSLSEEKEEGSDKDMM